MARRFVKAVAAKACKNAPCRACAAYGAVLATRRRSIAIDVLPEMGTRRAVLARRSARKQ